MVVLVLNRTYLKIGHTRDNGQLPYTDSKTCPYVAKEVEPPSDPK